MSGSAPVGLVVMLLVAIRVTPPLAVASEPEALPLSGEYALRVFTKEQGLPENQVQCLLQSRDGFVWIGTRKGLARFDGVKFNVFDRSNTPFIESDDFRFLAEDVQGNLWASTRAGLLEIRDGQCRPLNPGNELPMPSAPLLLPGKQGELWIGAGGWLIRHDGAASIIYGRSNGVEAAICSLEEDDTGTLWIGDEKSLKRFDVQTGTASANFKPDAWQNTLPQCIKNDRQGNMWVAFAEAEIHPDAEAPIIRHWVRWYANDQWQDCPGNPHSNDGRPFFLLTDREGGVWMPGGKGSVVRYHRGKLVRYALAGEGANTYAQCGLADREGNLWFGTEAGGVQCWQPRKVTTHATSDGLGEDNTWTICEARDGSVWVGTDGGLGRIQHGKIVNFRERDGLSRKEVRAVAEDRTGTIWVGTMSGLYCCREGKFLKYEFPGKWFEGKVRVILAARDGAVWVGTVLGLNRLHDGSREKFDLATGLAHEDVRALLEDRAGQLWIGSAGGGLQCCRNGSFTTITTTNGLSSLNVWALHEDADGVIWVGTDTGLNRFHEGRFTIFTTREGLPDNLVNCILEDDFGRLWISHDRGIYWVWKKELDEAAAGRTKSIRCVSYDESDGLPSIETNGQKSNPAGCKTRDGRLWFPTTKGVAVIDPRRANLDEVAPLAAVESVRANGKTLFNNSPHTEEETPAGPESGDSVAAGQSTRPDTRASTRSHQLAPGAARVLEFRYTANTLVSPGKTRFKYRLIGLDDHWVDAGARREAYFTDLRPGRYQFEVIAGSHRGVWQEHGATFAFDLAPFMYQTWWFLAGCGLAVAGLVTGVVLWRLHELRKLHRLERAAAITDERARLAKDLHDGLGADLTRLTMLADLAGGESGTGGGEYLKKISQSSRAATRELKELIWIANPANDSVDGLVSRLCQTAEDFLRDAGIKCRLEIAPQLPTAPLSLDQRRNLLLVTREALHNVVKHAQATEVRLRARGTGDQLQMEITDNGCGFDPGTARREGLGLESMKRRIANLGGSFALESQPGAGTTIAITIRLLKPS